MSKYEAVYFVGDNQAINRVRVDSSNMRNRGAFSGSLAALLGSFRNWCNSICSFVRFLSVHQHFRFQTLTQKRFVQSNSNLTGR